MATLQELADALARDVLAAAHDDEDPIVDQVGKVVGASSNTLQEAYLTAIRIRRAEARGRLVIAERLAQKAQEDRAGADGDDG